MKSQNLRGSFLAMIFIGLVAGISFFALQQIKVKTTDNIRNSLQIVLQTVRESHHLWITERNESLALLANTPKIIGGTEALLDLLHRQRSLVNSEPLAQVRGFLLPLLKKHGDEEFFIIAPDRTNIASPHDTEIGQVNLIQEQRKALLTEAFAGVSTFIPSIELDVSLESTLGDSPPMAMFQALPIFNTNGHVIAVFAIHIHPFAKLSRITHHASRNWDVSAKQVRPTPLTKTQF